MGLYCHFILMCFLFIVLSSRAVAMSLPVNLSESDRIRVLEVLGFGSAPKILDKPYPLGGYTGIEVGISSEFIPVEDLASLGNKTSERGELNYYTLSFGKGLYYNVDTYLYFTPFLQNEKVQTYGGQLRWGFYETIYFPISFSAVFFAGGANFSNLFNVTTVGVDLIATVAMDNVAIYFGGGRARAVGRFIGGTDGITDTQETEKQDTTENHAVFGLNIDISKMFVAFEVDRYADSNYSAKLGYRF